MPPLPRREPQPPARAGTRTTPATSRAAVSQQRCRACLAQCAARHPPRLAPTPASANATRRHQQQHNTATAATPAAARPGGAGAAGHVRLALSGVCLGPRAQASNTHEARCAGRRRRACLGLPRAPGEQTRGPDCTPAAARPHHQPPHDATAPCSARRRWRLARSARQAPSSAGGRRSTPPTPRTRTSTRPLRVDAAQCSPAAAAHQCRLPLSLRPPALAPGSLRSPGAFKRRRTSLAATHADAPPPPPRPVRKHSSAAAGHPNGACRYGHPPCPAPPRLALPAASNDSSRHIGAFDPA